MAGLRGNEAIEDAAIFWVMELERGAGRDPVDTRHRGAPAAVESPPRLSEGTDAIVTFAIEGPDAGTGRFIDQFDPVPW